MIAYETGFWENGFQGWVGSLIGSVVGGLVTLGVLLLTLRYERRQARESDLRAECRRLWSVGTRLLRKDDGWGRPHFEAVGTWFDEVSDFGEYTIGDWDPRYSVGYSIRTVGWDGSNYAEEALGFDHDGQRLAESRLHELIVRVCEALRIGATTTLSVPKALAMNFPEEELIRVVYPDHNVFSEPDED